MNVDQVKAKLSKKTDKELREIAKRARGSKREMRKTVNKLYLKAHEARWKLDDLAEVERIARMVRGRRKGEKCPGMFIKETRSWRTIVRCKARRAIGAWTRDVEGMYAQYCATCRLTHEKARAQMNWIRMLEGKR